MKTVISYTLEKCRKCMKCLKSCPTGAVFIQNQRVEINHDRCINCGKCIDACLNQGLQAKGSTLVDIKNYDYSICLVPSSMICDYKTQEEVEELFYAIKLLGFDEVVDISDIEGQVVKEAQLLSDGEPGKSYISSFCPVVNKLIEVKYPMLLSSILAIDYPSEIAARQLRKKYTDKGKIGIFNCCECIAKLNLAKYPYGNFEFEVDHALAIVDIFPFIKENMKNGRIPVVLCREGLQSCSPNTMLQNPDYLMADGFDKISNILEHAEFGLLNEFNLLTLFPCFNGCLGGNLLWGNSYLMRNNIHQLCHDKQKPIADLPFEELYGESTINQVNDMRSIQEKLAFFAKVNHQLEGLPGYDCGACGYPSCRTMAEGIALGFKSKEDCRILRNEVKQHESE
ncbi:MAG: [Fe-Fe] hydrogenase large subunit C-terminal domain-containing protein [Anaerorhabdus sp.]|uniref:[Fe-Fe] hydrogenase large subunit C-terminal domain-containing protein n=1 Tax=Anaerorhabdus sp. TaxID=1872524 RepID=UPI003A8798AB